MLILLHPRLLRDDLQYMIYTVVYLGFKVWDKNLEFQCVNSKPAIAPKKNEVGGLGLKNIKRRLELLFPVHYTLEIKEDETSYTVYLHLTL